MVLKAKTAPMTDTCIPTSAYMMQSHHNSLTSKTVVDRTRQAGARLEATYALGLPVLEPRTKWIGDDFNGAVPVATCIRKFVLETIKDGIHVLDMFSGITCGGLRTILEGGYNIKCYTSIEIDEISRTIAREVLSKI